MAEERDQFLCAVDVRAGIGALGCVASGPRRGNPGSGSLRRERHPLEEKVVEKVVSDTTVESLQP